MHPILFDLFGLKVYTYGVMASLAMIVGYLLSIFFAKKQGIEPHKIENIFLFGIIGAILGARLAYVIEHHNEMTSFFSPFEIWQGGLDWFGGLIGGIITILAIIKYYNLDPFKVADIAAIALPIGQAIGRIGCTSAGCCYGKEVSGVSDLSVGVHFMSKFPYFYMVFPEGAIAPPHVPLYPTELMDLFFNLFIFIGAITIFYKKRFDGEVFVFYLFFAGLFRFIEEFYRGVTPPIPGIGLTWNQIVCIGMMIGSVVLWFILHKKPEEKHA